ncbi:MAG TPA: polysaccharide biosynthesis tyrosine autokinase [Blastocatellia bacterium]|nr:polysaccharide biosynthesis tyrosine autokinase [Blastocatellia bacterium]
MDKHPSTAPIGAVQLNQQAQALDNQVMHSNGNGWPDPAARYEDHENPDESLHLRELWRKVRRRKWMIIFMVLVATSTVAVEVFRLKSVYQATTTIEISKDSPMMIKSGDVVIQSDDSDLMTSLFLLRSRPLLEDVVVNLRLDQTPAFMEVTKRRSLWEAFIKEKRLGQSADSDDELKDEESQRFEVGANRSREEHARLAPFVSILKGNLTVDQEKKTRLINISFTHTDPELATAVANGIAQQFGDRNFQKKTARYSYTSAWLDQSTRKLEAQVQKAEFALADYSRRNNIFSTEGKEDLTSSKLTNLHDQVMRAETDRLLKQSLYEEVKRGHVAQLPDAFSNQSTNVLQQKLGELAVQAAQLSVKYGARNPRVIETQEQMVAIRREIQGSQSTLEEKLKADYERAVRDESSLRAALSRAKAEAVEQNQTAIQFNILKQNVETSKTLYTDFLQKTSQADLQKAEQHRAVSIAEPADIPRIPVGPLRYRAILLAFMLSLAAGVGLAFLLDHLDNTLKTVDDVNRYVRLPALGVIPTIETSISNWLPGRSESRSVSVHGKNADSNIAEAYRMLRTSVLLSSAGRPPKTMLVTSSQPGEGKTTTAVNTSACLAQLGAKVVIIDADMRRPTVHKMLGVDQKPGLSTYLSSEVDLMKLVKPTKIQNLYILSAGLIPPSPAELISSERMRIALQKLSEEFDHVVVDSPPIGSVTDPVIISRQVEGVILVVHGGKSTREMVRHARKELTSVGAKIFGVVLNNVKLNRDGYDYYYRRYQYEYKSNASQLKA